jgi:ABC-type bacteriocin/lantibiotic exporter with double-glycine peptidase domain
MPATTSPNPTSPAPPVHGVLLSQLAAITGTEFDHERAKIAAQNAFRSGAEPLAQLVAAAAETYMHVSPVRMPLSQLVWQAHHETPVVIWNARESKWLIISFSGWFSLRLTDPDHPAEHLTISRGQLAKALGLTSVDDTVEGGIVHPERPAHGMSSQSRQEPNGAGHEHVSPVRRFFGLIRAERQDVSTLLIFSVFAGILYLAAPLAVDAVVSNLAFGGQQAPYVQALVVLSIGLFACLALQAVINGFQYYISDIIQRRIFVRTASDLAYRLPRVKAESLDNVHAPELVNRFLDVVTVQKSTALLLLDGVNLVFGGLIGMLLLALYHPVLLLFVAVLLTLIVTAIWLFGRGAVDTSIRESRMKYDLVNWFEEIATFPFLFKGPGGYAMAYERANQLATDYVTARGRHFRILMRQIAGLLAIQVFAAASLLGLGGWLVISQQITLGQLVASELIITAIVASLAKLGKKLEAWYDTMAAMDKLGHIFDLEIEREDGEHPLRREAPAEVTANAISFGYLEGAPLFVERSFTIRAGARVGIVGPHGSGASSLLDILFGLRTPTSGFVAIDGIDLRTWYLETLREQVELIRREQIVEGSVIENIRLGRVDIGMDEIRAALERVGLLEDLLHRPEGLNLRLKIAGAPLSGNQRTRLLLARALVQRPRLLLLDEILDGLDPASFAQLAPAIFDRSLPWTVVLTTRDHDVIKLCDEIIELNAQGPADVAGSQGGRHTTKTDDTRHSGT